MASKPISAAVAEPAAALRFPRGPYNRPVAPPTPTQLAWRARIEAGLHFAAPFLDLLLAAGDRISRAVDRDALDAPAPARAEIEPAYAPRRHVGPGAPS
jgi:hypothetical protein